MCSVHVPDVGDVSLPDLPIDEYAFPGPLRDRLVAAILDGSKTTTASLLEEYRRFGEELPQTGTLKLVVDSENRPVCITRLARVEVVRLADVSDAHAVAEGEGFETAAQWRVGHEQFWTSPEYAAEMGAPAVILDDDTQVVLETIEVLARL